MIELLAGIFALALDQITKLIVLQRLAPIGSTVVIPHILSFTYVQNTHGAFGIGPSSTWIFALVAAGVLVAINLMFRDLASKSRLAQVALGLIAGGAMGNIVDRFRLHFVVDFIDFKIWQYVFNVADTAVNVAAVLLVIAYMRRSSRARA